MVELLKNSATSIKATINTLNNQSLVNQNREIRSKLSVYLAKVNTLDSNKDQSTLFNEVENTSKEKLFFAETERGSIINTRI